MRCRAGAANLKLTDTSAGLSDSDETNLEPPCQVAITRRKQARSGTARGASCCSSKPVDEGRSRSSTAASPTIKKSGRFFGDSLMIKEMIVNSSALETKIALLEDDQLAELYIERNWSRGILGNIYKGKVTKVLPGMQSAFVNIGLEKDAFLYVSDFIEDTEEYDKVFTEAEEQVATVMAQIETVEKPSRRERRPERGRWRDRERRDSPRAWPQTPEVSADKRGTAESWTVRSDSERSLAVDALLPFMNSPSEIPPPVDPVAETQPASVSQAEAELPPLSGASIRDDGEVAPFAVDGNHKGSFNGRRRGPGARRRRYTAARHNRPER